MHTSTSLVLRRFSLATLFTLILAIGTRAQNPIEDAIEQLSSDNVKGYVQPFVNSFGANLNSGHYTSAHIGEAGFSFKFHFVGMGTLIGDAEKVYTATSPYDGSPVRTATIFGEQGTVVNGPPDPSNPSEPIVTYEFPSGQVKTSIVPMLVPQITVGNVMGTQAMLRYIPIPEFEDFPKTTLFGIGLRHSVSRYIPMSPVDLAAGFSYHSFTIGDIISANAFSFGAQVSKKTSVVTFYGGLQYENSSIELDYTFQDSKINVSVDGENKFRATAGIGLSLAFLHLNADINIGKVTVASAGIGFGL